MRRPLPLLIVATMTAALLGALPAQAETNPTTLAVEGTLQVIAVDTFGDDAHADHLYSVLTDDGAEIPIDLDGEAPANGRFSGELVVTGEVASALDDKDLLPQAGSTIAEDTRAGRAAVAVAEEQEAPLAVASSNVAPVTAAAVTAPAAHQVYVAVLDNRGSVEETDPQVASIVGSMTDYWVTESTGVIPTFQIQGDIKHFSSTAAGTTDQSCGMASPSAVWNEARLQFPGISFATGSRNHLFVAMADECGDAGIAGVASVGVDLSSGGPMSFSMGSIATQVGVHEIGHTFGLGHANLATCTGSCEYFDLYSPMALAVSGATFNPPALGSLYRSRLGVAATDEVTQMSLTTGQTGRDETFALAPRAGSTGLRGVVVTDPTNGVKYSIDWRTRTARDAGTFYGSQYSFGAPLPTYSTGVVIEREDTSGDTALMTDAPTSRASGSFASGRTFSPSAGLAVTVGSIGSTAAVTVRIGSAEIQSATPTISGTVAVDQTVTAVPGAWETGTVFTYDWRLGNVSTGATGSTYAIPASAAGSSLTVRVTGSKAGRTSVTQESAPSSVAPGAFSSGTVAVSGSPVVGQTLTAVTGTWTPTPAFTYAWSIGGSVRGTDQTFLVPADAATKTITLAVTGTRSGYTPRSVSATTAAVTTASLPPVQSTNPTIDGRVAVGGTVTAVPGTWTAGTAFTYDWKLDGTSIGVTDQALVLPPSAAGRSLTVSVTGTNTGYAADTRTSASAVVALGTFAGGSVTSSGAVAVGSTVTAAIAGWPADVAVTYQWERNNVPIAGATAPAFAIPASFVGSQLRVVATGTRAGYAAVAAGSAPAVVAAARLAAKTPRVSGTARVGKTLKVTVGSWSPRPSYRYQWYANGRKITQKGTKSSFKLTSRQKGKRITVKVTGRKTGYTTVTKTSARTKKVARK